MLSMFMLGPLPGFALLAICAVSWSVSVYGRRRNDWSRSFARRVDLAGAAALIALLVFLAVDTKKAASRSPADVIARWAVTPVSRQLMGKLKAQEPASLPEYRKLLKMEPSFETGQAALRLAEIGDPLIDVPPIIAALERTEKMDKNYYDSDFREALEKATSAGLSQSSTSAEWRAEWERRRAAQ